MPYPGLLHPEPLPLWQATSGDKHSKAGLAQPLWVLLIAQGFVWALQGSLVGMGFESKCDFAPPTVLLGLLPCPWMWGIFFGGIQHSPVNGYSEVSCNFQVLTGEDECKWAQKPLLVNKRVWNVRLGCNPKNDSVISVCFQGKLFNITVI